MLKVPSSAELAVMKPLELRVLLWQAASRLKARLAALENGQGWINYLQVDTLAKQVSSPEAFPREKTTHELRAILDAFHVVAADKEYETINSMPEFKVVAETIQITGPSPCPGWGHHFCLQFPLASFMIRLLPQAA